MCVRESSKDAIIFERGVKSRIGALACHLFTLYVMLAAVAVDFQNIVA